MFTGFTEQTAAFLWGIRFNNERSWFEANKATYLSAVQQPMRELGTELYDHMVAAYPDLWLNLHVSRIYRDARRLHGRGPYKDHLWLSLRHENEDWTCRPVFYFEITPEGCSYGMGFYSATPQTMERFRQETMADPRPLTALTKRLHGQRLFHLEGETYAREKPSPSPLLQPWMNCKRLSIECSLPYDEVLFSHALVEKVQAGFDFLVPFYRHFSALCQQA